MSYSDAIAQRVESLSKSVLINGVTPLAGRVLLAAIFLLSGVSKISDPAGTIGYINMVGLPFPTLSYGAAVVAEIAGSIALILGFQTRIVAFILAVFSVATAMTFHDNLSDLNQFIHFFKNIAMAGGLLQVVAFGAGRYSFDARH
ncbi:DoxX family membrane protein [Sinorhizobium medicae]|nr:DoxX family membrane protein [Sinorhizobium medicae]MDX0885299.1 DoxX family membrane protein [Sinorhizobium medicae]MDX0922538.1 DoxX family membrane protein [Sinorhizobium medicae]MDX0934843.1 DoxX family membrane protein [Sinorhizobium medicae]MDX0941189.1 DoxX family membrane protein [Sinorhizobium medicae]